jgi:hypothetical protein
MKKKFVILTFGKKQKAWNEIFFYPQNLLFGTRAENSILKKCGRPKSMVFHSFNKRTFRLGDLLSSYILTCMSMCCLALSHWDIGT